MKSARKFVYSLYQWVISNLQGVGEAGAGKLNYQQ